MARTMATGKEEEMAEVFVDFLSKRIKVLNSKNIFPNKKIRSLLVSVTFMICCDVEILLISSA